MERKRWLAPVAALAFVITACDSPPPTAPPATPLLGEKPTSAEIAQLAREVRELARGRGVVALGGAPRVRKPLSRLGQALAFDPILSGHRNISCMTCHLPRFATGDAKSLSVGEGATGFGPERSHPLGVFIPRNAPPLFNLGAMRRLFWDGRIQIDDEGQLHTPAGAHVTPAMRRVMEFGAVSAIGLFPVTNRAEMRGLGGNELAEIPDENFTAIWSALMARLGRIPEYRAMFEAAYPGTKFRDMTFAYASNAIGAFFVGELTLNNSPWDQFLAGNDGALTKRQLEGAKTFLTIRCSLCHNGATFSDQEFHNVAVAQVGPGSGNGLGGRDDFGRMNVTGLESDRYRFRTTPLRNVELTAPYGHAGANLDLREFIEHYSESDLKLRAFTDAGLEPLLQGTLVDNVDAILAQRDTILDGVVLPDAIVDQLMDYMSALTDARALNLSYLTPRRVPSKLPVAR